VRDTVNLRKLGIPTIGLVHDRFEKLAKLQLKQLGEPDLPIIYYKQDLPGVETANEISNKARDVAEQVHDQLVQDE
jgi:hypothetical protein